MISKPLFSAIITTYNREPKILERALKSIINQTYSNIEIIIVNDCPTNIENNKRISKMINKYSNYNIKYIVVKENGGACKARNIGINNAKGEFVGFLDDDDEWVNTKIEIMMDIISNDDKISLVYSNAFLYDETSGSRKKRFLSEQPSGKIFNNLLITNLIGSTSFPIFRKKVLDQVGGFDEKMPALQDWELYLRISQNNFISYIDECLTVYHLFEGERISKNTQRRVDAYNLLFNKFNKYIKSNKSAFYAFCEFGTSIYSLNGNCILAFKKYFKMLQLFPLRIVNNIKVLLKIIIRIFNKKNNL